MCLACHTQISSFSVQTHFLLGQFLEPNLFYNTPDVLPDVLRQTGNNTVMNIKRSKSRLANGPKLALTQENS